MKIDALPGPFGVLIDDIDLSQPLPPPLITSLVDLLYRHRILLIAGQRLSKTQYARFGRHWGTPLPFFIESHRDPEEPDLIHITNAASIPPEQRGGAAHWHTDSSYETVPASVTMLYCIESPWEGGETLFADMAAAYDALPAERRRQIDGLRVRHMVKGGQAIALAGEKLGSDAHDIEVTQQREKEIPTHPLVRINPVTGHKALYAISGTACGIEGMSQAEAIALLAELKAHALQPRFIHSRCKATAGDILIWDNLSTLHSATPLEYSDDDGKRRLLYRISTTGLPAVYADRRAA